MSAQELERLHWMRLSRSVLRVFPSPHTRKDQRAVLLSLRAAPRQCGDPSAPGRGAKR